MQKIIPHLWYDKEAKEAAEFYCSIFPDSGITKIITLNNTPSGDADVVSFQLSGQHFMAISAGPVFKFNPSISFILNFDLSRRTYGQDAGKYLDSAWQKLSQSGTVLMPLDKYPFSERYGWLQDKYGLSWQLILLDTADEERPFIVPSLFFVGDNAGKTEEAANFYQTVFKNSKQGQIARYPEGMEPDKEGTIMYIDFMLENQWFAAMDSAREHNFNFNEAISFLVNCNTQKEIDYYWEKLSFVPESEQCGWVKDKYRVSWQISPAIMGEMLSNGTKDQVARVTQAFLQMKKINIADLEKSYKG